MAMIALVTLRISKGKCRSTVCHLLETLQNGIIKVFMPLGLASVASPHTRLSPNKIPIISISILVKTEGARHITLEYNKQRFWRKGVTGI
jgi:hypothetical protein